MLAVIGSGTVAGPLTIGVAPQNTLTITPGVTATNPVVLAASGAGGVSLQVTPTTAPLIIQASGGFVPPVAFNAQTLLQLNGATALGANIEIDAAGSGGVGGTAGFSGRSYNDAGGIPSGRNITAIRGYGWTGAAYTATESVRMILQAAEAFTPTANGSQIILQTTPLGSTALGNSLTIGPSGQLAALGGLGVFGVVAPSSRPTVNGAWAGNTAGKALCVALAATGLIIDGTSA
jgi:hypothetical protein